ncbi:MAG: HlyD family secretion protein [Gammaproteobacteria bacterium]
MNIRPPLLPLAAALALASASWFVWSSQPKPIAAEPIGSPPATTYARTVAAVGLVEPASENIAISTPLPGLVTAVHVAAGQRVAAGAPLFTLDDRAARATLAVRAQQVAAARAALERLEASPRPEDLPPLRAQVRVAEQALADARVQQRLIEDVDDPRAISREDLLRRRIATEAAAARLDAARAELARVEAGAWRADLDVARAALALAERERAGAEVDLERLTVRAPRAGTVLKIDARPGEYAQTGALAAPLIVFGDTDALHVRADVDEQQALLVVPGADAIATPRGAATTRVALEFVRIEPLVVPKKQLTGDVVERVDTRVLQVIYRVKPGAAPLFVGQQVDVFIDREATPVALGQR